MAGEKIFLVDDDPDMVEALRLPLEAKGYETFHAGSGREAPTPSRPPTVPA